MDIMSQGLQFSLIGLIAIFIFMLLFWGVMALLTRLFPEKDEEAEKPQGQTLTQTAVKDGGEDKEIVAAIAAAVNYLRSTSESKLGARLEQAHGSWWAARLSASRQKNIGVK